MPFNATRGACGAAYGTVGGSLVVVGPYVCTPNDQAAGDGCGAFSACSGSLRCAKDSHNNNFCSSSCTGNSTCGNPGVACCNLVDVNFPNVQVCGLCASP
jgi:hypothetical protein